MRGKGTGRIRSRRQKRKRRVRIRSDGHESLSSLRIQNPVLGGRIASAESSGVDRVLQDCSSWPKPHATEAERPCAYDAVRARPLCTDRSAALRPQRLSSARARSPELGAAGGHGQQQRFDASLGAGGHCSRGAEAVRHARNGLQLHWQLPERVWSAAIV